MTAKIGELYSCNSCGCSTEIKNTPKNGQILFTVFCPCCKNPMVKVSPTFPTYAKVVSHFDVDFRDAKTIQQRVANAQAMHRAGIRSDRLSHGAYGSAFLVKSEDQKDGYIVTEKGGRFTCNCPDHIFRHVPCKHIILTIGYHY